jgi:hypothetical protein
VPAVFKCERSLLTLPHLLTGILNVDHDQKLSSEEIVAVWRSIAALLMPGGTAIIFLDPAGVVEWQGKLGSVQSLALDQWLHVSLRDLKV